MNVFEAVKQSVTTRQAAEHYGIHVGRNGMACCPFHHDKTPSMKLDRRYHCFGCGADGDVIDFAAALYGLGKKEAAVQLAQDFGLSYEDWKPPGKAKKPKPRQKSPEEQFQEAKNRCFRTNVELNNRMVCYDIKQLGQQLKKIGMLVVQDQVWNRVTINRAAHKTTRYYVDEFHLLLREAQTAAYSVEIWKRFRKWGGIPTGITQNVKDLLASREVESIFENSNFIMLLDQAPGDREILAKRLNISKHQLAHITQVGPGEGLLIFGSVMIPFVDHFPKDTMLYRIMSTKPNEAVEEGVNAV